MVMLRKTMIALLAAASLAWFADDGVLSWVAVVKAMAAAALAGGSFYRRLRR